MVNKLLCVQYFGFGTVFAFLFAIDRLAKYVVYIAQPKAGPLDIIIPGILELRLVTNRNIVFWFSLPNWLIILLVVTVMVLALAATIRFYNSNQHEAVAWMTLILVGAFSNLLDRLRFGAVIDFISIPFWSVFNFADIYILLGVVALLVHLRKKKNQTPGVADVG